MKEGFSCFYGQNKYKVRTKKLIYIEVRKLPILALRNTFGGSNGQTKKENVPETKFSMIPVRDTNLWNQGHVSRVRALDCQSDKVLSGSDDRSVKLWSIETGNKNQGQKTSSYFYYLCAYL